MPTSQLKMCCADLTSAVDAGTVKIDQQLGSCLVVKDGNIVPFTYCPWCAQQQPRTLHTSPAMLYRP